MWNGKGMRAMILMAARGREIRGMINSRRDKTGVLLKTGRDGKSPTRIVNRVHRPSLQIMDGKAFSPPQQT